jgi:hypothetical protein
LVVRHQLETPAAGEGCQPLLEVWLVAAGLLAQVLVAKVDPLGRLGLAGASCPRAEFCDAAGHGDGGLRTGQYRAPVAGRAARRVTAAGCERIFTDQRSGCGRDRPGLRELLG